MTLYETETYTKKAKIKKEIKFTSLKLITYAYWKYQKESKISVTNWEGILTPHKSNDQDPEYIKNVYNLFKNVQKTW